MTVTETLGRKVLAGGQLTKKEAMTLYGQPLEELCTMADTVRARFHAQAFSLCTIVNGKSGRCTENCRFCAQSAHYHTEAAVYPLCDQEEILAQAKRWQAQGVPRFGIVTAGRRLSGREVEEMCRTIRRVRRETEISLCVSFGLLREEEYRALKEAGVERVHNNLETSRCYFPQVCTTHTFEDKLTAIRAAQAAGLTVCCGGIVGMGETPEDRIDMALTLRELGISSGPLNLLQGIPGTPLAQQERLSQEELRRIVAVYRLVLPGAVIRLAGGRGLLSDRGRGCFQSGANGVISGDMLTTAGITVETDRNLLEELGYEVK